LLFGIENLEAKVKLKRDSAESVLVGGYCSVQRRLPLSKARRPRTPHPTHAGAVSKMDKYQQRFGFGMMAFKKFPELIPLAAIISSACVGCAAFCGYALATKPDVRLNKSSELPPWERVQPGEYRKMRVVNKDIYKIDPEVEKLRREIGSFRP